MDYIGVGKWLLILIPPSPPKTIEIVCKRFGIFGLYSIFASSIGRGDGGLKAAFRSCGNPVGWPGPKHQGFEDGDEGGG